MLQQEEVLFANGSSKNTLTARIRGSNMRSTEPIRVDDDTYDNINQQSSNERFDNLVNRGTRVLFKIQTVFPIDLFPKSLTIDVEKVTVKFQEFFSSGEIRSISVGNIGQVYVDMGPFFATLDIVDKVIMDEASRISISHLKKVDAMRARRIIQGLIMVHNEKIDIGELTDKYLVRKLEQLGRMQ